MEVDFEEGFEAFLVAGSALGFAFVLEAAFAGLAATLSSLASFFTVALFPVSFASLVAVSFLAAGFFVTADFVALEVVLDPDLVADLAGAFLVEVVLETFTGLFWQGIRSTRDVPVCSLPPWCRCRCSWRQSLEGA